MPNQKTPRVSSNKSDIFAWQKHLSLSLRRAFTITILSVLLNTLALWGLTILPQFGFFTEVVNSSLDLLTEQIYRFNLQGPKIENQSEVWLVKIDDELSSFIRKAEYSGIPPRETLADILNKLHLLEPSAIFVDIDLSDTANEAFELSNGDKKLISFFNTLGGKGYPLFLASTKQTTYFDEKDAKQHLLLGKPITQPNICVVLPSLSSDNGMVRRFTFGTTSELGAAYALYLTSKMSTPPKSCQDFLNSSLDERSNSTFPQSSIGSRMIFRPWKNEGLREGFPLQSFWNGGFAIPGRYLLNQNITSLRSQINSGAIFILGVTSKTDNRDLFFTPAGTLSGAEIHFNSLMTLLSFQKTLNTFGILQYIIIFITLTIVYFLSSLLSQQSPFHGLDAWIEGVLLFFTIIPAVILISNKGIYINHLLPAYSALILGTLTHPITKKINKSVTNRVTKRRTKS